MYSVCSTRDVEEQNDSCLYQRIRVLCRLGEAHRVERLLLSQCGKTQMARMISKQTGKATWPTFGRIQVCSRSCYVALIFLVY